MLGRSDTEKRERQGRRWRLVAVGGTVLIITGVVVALLMQGRPSRPLPVIEVPQAGASSPARRRARPGGQSSSSEHTVEKVTTTRSSDGVRTTTTRTTVKTTRTVRRSRN